jgi:hypothetical protein
MKTAILAGLMIFAIAAAPASQPASRPSGDSDLRAMIAQLQAQVAVLKKENASLKQQLATAYAAIPKPTTKPVTVTDAKELALGMTLDEANAVMGKAGEMVRESDGAKVYEWKRYGLVSGTVVNGVAGGYGRPHTRYITWASFRDGKLAEHGKDEEHLP